MDEGTFYRLGDDNPAGVEWVVTMQPEQAGFSITISNTEYRKRIKREDATPDRGGVEP